MKLIILKYLVMASLAILVWSEPAPQPAKASRYSATQYFKDDGKEAGDDFYPPNKKLNLIDSTKKGDTSSGRLFMRKFFFKNMFGQNQNQNRPIIPIIIMGGNTDSGINTDTITNIDTVTGDTPTNTNTATAEEPIATTIDTAASPETPTADSGANPPNPNGRIQLYARGSADENVRENQEDATTVDGEAVAAAAAPAPSGGAEEYILTDEEIKGTTRAKSNRASSYVNLRIRGAQRGEVVRVRIPAKYSGYFKNGQSVYRRTRPVKRRTVRRRKNRRRPNKNKNKRPRIVAA